MHSISNMFKLLEHIIKLSVYICAIAAQFSVLSTITALVGVLGLILVASVSADFFAVYANDAIDKGLGWRLKLCNALLGTSHVLFLLHLFTYYVIFI